MSWVLPLGFGFVCHLSARVVKWLTVESSVLDYVSGFWVFFKAEQLSPSSHFLGREKDCRKRSLLKI